MNNKNKLIILIKNLSHGGAQKVCVTICNELYKRNHNIELWILDNKHTALSDQLHEKIKLTHINSKRVRGSIFKLARLLKKEKPPKILIFNVELAFLTIFLKKLFNLRTYIIFRSINTLSRAYTFPSSMWEKYFAVKGIRYFLPLCDKIIAQSTGMKKDMIKYFKVHPSKIETIFNPAVNLSENEIQHQETQSNNFLYVGRLQAQKGLTNLIRIFAKIREEYPNATLNIVGDGPEMNKLVSLTQELNLTSAIHFRGYQPNPYPYFMAAKATLLTSLYEGFPNVLVESIKAGTPVIAYNCPSGPDDIIEDDVNGILVPNQNSRAFIEAMKLVAGDHKVFEKALVQNSAKKFSLEKIIDKYEKLIKI